MSDTTPHRADSTAAPAGVPVSTSPPVLELDGVSVARGGATVWSQASFRVGAGEIVGVIGPNGSGKTTLLDVLLGMLEPASGRVEVLGHTPRRGSSRIGYVPQNYAATVGDTARGIDLVGLGLVGARWGMRRLSAEQRSKVERAIAGVGASAYAHRRMSKLSGGQQQRVAIAQALVAEPELLLLDEPLANLDLRNQHEIVALLGRLRDETGVTILLVAHDLNPLLPVLDSAIYLLDGHAHYGRVGDVVDGDLLTHLYGTPIRVVRTAQGDLFTRGG